MFVYLLIMQFITKSRDGYAKIGLFKVNKERIFTPNILFINTKRFKAPCFADIQLTKELINTKKPNLKYKNNGIDKGEEFFKLKNKDIVIIKYASQLFDQPAKFVNTYLKIKSELDDNFAIYIPSICKPSNLSLLAYMGVDFFDSTFAIIAARKNFMLFQDGEFPLEDLKEIPCNCFICSKVKNPSNMSFEQILNHNYVAFYNELKFVRNMIKKENLRSLVEKRVKSNPLLTAILRNLDMNYYNLYEEKTPVSSNNIIYANFKESMFRPEIKRFQKRVIERYKKPLSTKILVLLPCSAKKPYSFSESHKYFIENIQSSPNPNVVHELIVTSPLGVVPRELELTYPASNYDIPVTGIWDEDEKLMIRKQLKAFLNINKYDSIIIHLPNELTKFIKDLILNPIFTCIDKPSSKKSLKKLSSVLNIETSKYEKITNQTRNFENIKSLVCYQFGRKPAEFLMNKTLIKGRYPYYKIFSENKQIGMLVKKRGLISLTLEGAHRLFKSNEYWVEIFDDFELIGSVFAPGIKNTDKKIRKGDDVVLIKNKKLAGVGVAQMSGQEMISLNYGEAVKIRHKI